MASQNEIEFAKLMAQAQEGDSVAYQSLLLQINGFLGNYLKKKIFNSTDREDILQDCLLSLHKARHTYDSQKSFMSWFLAIVEYKCIDYFRKNKVKTEELILETLQNELPTDDSDVKEDVRLALSKIDPSQRQVIELLKFEGLKISEISEKLGLSEANIKVKAHRGYQDLKKHLGKKYE